MTRKEPPRPIGQEMILEGSIRSVVYANEGNGYAVLAVDLDEGGTASVVGTLVNPAPGEHISAQGRWETNRQYGEQFRAEKMERFLPETTAGIYSYLSSGVLKGVGPATARKIVERFGRDSLQILENEPERLAEARIMPEKKAREISLTFRSQAALRRLLEFCSAHELSDPGPALRLYGSYGEDAMEVLYANPYLLCEEYYGAGFAETDRLAISIGFGGDSPERIEAAILFELTHNARNGHCFIPEEKLIDAVSRLIGVGAEEIAAASDRLTEEGETVSETVAGRKAVYLRSLYEAETNVARHLLRKSGKLPDAGQALRRLNVAVSEMEIELAEAQRQAVLEAVQVGVFVLTGGPGTGKTTTIRAIMRVFDLMGLNTALTAPTGRAAKRMQELCGREAQTVHRLLEAGYDPESGMQVFRRDEEDPLPADVIILDEASMMDITLADALLRAMKPASRLILVGDADQLPSVGPGNFLRDVLRSGAVPAVTLKQVFRQAEESRIIRTAHEINRGEQPELRNSGGDFFFLRRKTGETALSTVLELITERLPEKMGIPAEEIQVLSPTRLQMTGTGNLNRTLQEALNPAGKEKPEKPFGNVIFRTGDRVMQIRNNYDLEWTTESGNAGVGVFNGDVGTVREVDLANGTLTVAFEDRLANYPFELLSELEHAYAMTVHKSQGSEYRAVILLLVSGAKTLLNRSVLYTAVTRAKELLIVVGDDLIFTGMVENDRTVKRYSGLKTRLAEDRT